MSTEQQSEETVVLLADEFGDYLRQNMFDGDLDGRTTMETRTLVAEVTDVLADYFRDEPTAFVVSAKQRPYIVEVYRQLTWSRNATRFEADEHTPYEYRWRARHKSNGEVMASGEGYADPRDRDHAVEVLFPGVEVVEVDS